MLDKFFILPEVFLILILPEVVLRKVAGSLGTLSTPGSGGS